MEKAIIVDKEYINSSFDNDDYKKENFPFLIQTSKVACHYQDESFLISRKKSEYKFFTLHYILDGTGYFQVEDDDYIVHSGDIFVLVADESHTYYNASSENLGLLWIEFDCSGCEDLYLWFKEKKLRVLNQDTEQIAEKIYEILKYVKNNNPISQFKLSELSYSLIMNLYENINKLETLKISNTILKAKHYIAKHFKEDIKIEDLAKYLNISESGLTKEFKKQRLPSPWQYIILKKIKHAIFLLKNTNLTCDKIATECGFCDASHLYKVFSKNLNKNPSDFR